MATITTETVLDMLNSALILDDIALSKLINNRVACNSALANSKTRIIIGHSDTVGALGVINGILAHAGQPLIAACYLDGGSDSGEIIEFVRHSESASPIA